MYKLALLPIALVALVVGMSMPLAAAAAPRRALAGAGYVDTCYDKPHARVERWAIDYMCADVKKGAAETWLIESVGTDPCETEGQVTVIIGGNGEPVATSSKGVVCKTANHRVAVDANLCSLYAAPAATACRGYVDDREKAAKSHNILTVHEVPEPKYSATVRFQIRLKANCQSLEDPVFKSWFGTAQVLEGVPCNGATYEGDFTYGVAPKDPFEVVPAPPVSIPGPGPNNVSPSPGQSPPDDGPDDGPDGDVDEEDEDRK